MRLFLLPLFALLAVAPAQAGTVHIDGWELHSNKDGCMLLGSFQSGTVISMYGDTAKTVMVTFQNKQWLSLRHEQKYKVKVEVDSLGEWSVNATAYTNIDSDGPGLRFFQGIETDENGDNFFAEFAAGKSMTLTLDNGRQIDAFGLRGTYKSTIAFVRCLASRNPTMKDPFIGIKPETNDPFKGAI